MWPHCPSAGQVECWVQKVEWRPEQGSVSVSGCRYEPIVNSLFCLDRRYQVSAFLKIPWASSGVRMEVKVVLFHTFLHDGVQRREEGVPGDILLVILSGTVIPSIYTLYLIWRLCVAIEGNRKF